MTPNRNSSFFIRHEVPEYACENSKKLSKLFHKLKKQVAQGKWDGISEKDFYLTYNTNDGCTEVTAVFHDDNHHSHYFIMQLVLSNGFGDTDEDHFRLIYHFDGKFDENALSIRSFAEYICIHLEFEGFKPTLIKCDKGLSIPCLIEDANNCFCKLINIVQSNVKPLVWFYTKEPNIKSFEEMGYYLAGVQSKLQLESCSGRWNKINPECFKLKIYKDEEEATLKVTYIVDDVWELSLIVCVEHYNGFYDCFCCFFSYLNANLSEEIKRQLDVLFAEFLYTLKIGQGNVSIGRVDTGTGYRKDHYINIQYFYIEDTFDIFCKMLDEIVPALQGFNFQLPLPSPILTEEIESIKRQLETALNTTFEATIEEEEINKKLKNGYFLHS